MDYRKNMNTPRDMIDDEMLLRLMRETEPVAAVFGGNIRRENRRRNNTGNCGCRTTESRESRSGKCADNDYENLSRYSVGRCGCTAENREGPENSHSCGDNECYPEVRELPCESCANDDRMKHFRLAMAYVPWQEWEKIYEDEVALSRGTLFEALDLPWYQSACDSGSGVCRKCSDNR